MARHPEIQIVGKNPTKILLPMLVKTEIHKEVRPESVASRRDHCDHCDRAEVGNGCKNSNSEVPIGAKDKRHRYEISQEKTPTSQKNISNDDLIQSQRSQRSQSTIIISNMDFPPRCYHCSFSEYKAKQEYETHCLMKHLGKPAYPGLSDFKSLGLIRQGMKWEI